MGRNFVDGCPLWFVRMWAFPRFLRAGGWLLAILVAAGLFVPLAAQAFFVGHSRPTLYDGDAVGSGFALKPGATVVPRGPGGDMWLTTSAGRIARVAPTGVVTEFGHGITDGGAVWLAGGGDGLLWFSEEGTGTGVVMVGRITASGAITEYPSGVQSIDSFVRGGDGAVWYEGYCGSNRCLARMDSSGQVSTFTLPVSDSASPLALGGDGEIWLSVLPPPDATGEMIRVSSSGVMKTFLLPTGDVVDGEVPLVAGPGGGVWFTATQGQTHQFRLGDITDAGRVTLVGPGLTNANQVPLAAGPAGELWYDLDTASQSGPLRLMTPTGKVIAQMNGVALQGPLVPGPDHSLWSGTTEIAHANHLKAICDVADEVGSVLDGPPLHWVSDGCRYQVRTASPSNALRYPLTVYHQGTDPGRHISTGTPVVLQARQAPRRYGRCHVPRQAAPASVILRTPTAIVLQKLGDNAARYFACATHVGTQRLLPGGDLTNFTAAGSRLAYWTDNSSSVPSCYVTILNLATGKKTSISTTESLCPGQYDQVGPFAPDELAVNANGLVAWIVHEWGGAAKLYARDSTGTHVLDTGDPLDLGSLKFDGNALHWTNNNAPRQATLT